MKKHMPKATDPMTKKRALDALYEDFVTKIRSTSELRRLRRACRALNLDAELTEYVEYLADYRREPGSDVRPEFK